MIDRAQIEKMYKEMQPHFLKARDAAGYSRLFTEDAVWWPLGKQTRIGRAEIAEGFNEVIAGVSIVSAFELVDIQIADTFATAALLGTLTITPDKGGQPIVVHSREMWGFREVQNTVKISRMVWNQDVS